MKWLEEALKELGDGVHEIPGPESNPRVSEYHSVTAGGTSQDDVPWCASFVSWCLERASIQSTRSKAARSYLDWGVPTEPRFGAVTVLSRGSNPQSGHVGFYCGTRNGMIYLLGGNQGDRVSVARYPAHRLLAMRWKESA